MDSSEKVKRLKNLVSFFVSDLNLPGVCRIWVDDDISENEVWVYVELKLDYLVKSSTKGGSARLSQKIRDTVKEKIRDALGIYVQVGSIAKEC